MVEQLTRRGGVATRAELIETTSRREVDAALAAGSVVVLARGRYALPHADGARAAAHALTGVVCLQDRGGGRLVRVARRSYGAECRCAPLQRVRVEGWLVLRFLWEDVMFQPALVAAVLLAAVAERTVSLCPRCRSAS